MCSLWSHEDWLWRGLFPPKSMYYLLSFHSMCCLMTCTRWTSHSALSSRTTFINTAFFYLRIHLFVCLCLFFCTLSLCQLEWKLSPIDCNIPGGVKFVPSTPEEAANSSGEQGLKRLKSHLFSHRKGIEICDPHLTHFLLREWWAAAGLQLGIIGWFAPKETGTIFTVCGMTQPGFNPQPTTN